MTETPTYEELERRVQELERDNFQLKKELKEVHFFSEEIMRYMSEGLVLTDVRETVIFINHRLSQILGYLPEQIIGKSWLDMVSAEHLATAQEALARRAQGHIDRYEIILRHEDGHKFPVLIGAGPRFDKQSGKFIGTMGVVTDITDRKQAEDALKRKHTMLARTEAVAHVGSWEWEAEGDRVTWSKELFRIFGLEPVEKAPSFDEHQAFYVPDDRVRLVEAVEECLRNSVPYDLEVSFMRTDGQLRHCVVRGFPEQDSDGSVKRLYGSLHDITERKKTEETLNKSHEMLKFTEAMANIGSWEWDVQHDRTYWSEELFRIFGRDPSEGAPPFAEQSELYADGDMQRLRDAVEGCIKRGTRYEIELRAIRTDGDIRHCVSRGKAQYDENGKVFRLIGSFQDITKRKLSEDALRESENQINSIFRSAPVGIGSVVNRVLSKVNKRLCEITGYDERELIGQCSRMLYPSDEDFEYAGREKYAQIADHGTGTVETRWQKKDGSIIDVLLSSTPVDLQDQSKGVTFTALNITARKQAEMALKESEERFRTLMENIDAVAVQGYGPDGTTQYWNKASERLYGYSRQEAIGRNLLDLIIPSEMKGAVVEEMQEMAESGQPIPSGELLLMHKDGSRVPVISHHTIVRVPGREQELFCLDVDITERKQAEEERENLRKQLNQAQKMESVGRLAGGVAHDYNNMLGVILGHTEMALLQADETHDLYPDLKEIQKAAIRSADVTKQLLAFARKQTISPKQLDLNNTVASMLNMMRRLIGEDIDLLWKPSAHLWPVKMDSTQIDQILANLCVNAKDAIAGVGKLTIETGKQTFDEEYCNAHPGFIPGDFVMLAVSDNGCGMDKDILDNLFEPFFTTKKAGKGTGLGLATVYGIVKQNNGFINVYSEPGQGTTFKIYLSRFFADEGTDNKSMPEKNEAAGGTETILLVEDEPSILEITTMMLERKGYSVLPAAAPAKAIELAESHADTIHLLMTDVVMPEMNGKDLAEKLKTLYPDILLLFMSGYTSDVITHQGVLDDGVTFIQKPFSMGDLTEKVRDVLDTSPDKTQKG